MNKSSMYTMLCLFVVMSLHGNVVVMSETNKQIYKKKCSSLFAQCKKQASNMTECKKCIKKAKECIAKSQKSTFQAVTLFGKYGKK